MCSDHFAPWNERQGHSGFAWSWLGAALATTSLPFGVVNAPGQRYHPAIVAQAIATLGAMFPGRFWVALGSGEAMNEHITGDRWPRKDVRDARLRECVDVIRRCSPARRSATTAWSPSTAPGSGRCPSSRRALIAPAVSAATAGAARRLGRRPGHHQPAARQPARGDRRLPGRRRPRARCALQVHLSCDPDPDRALAHRARPVAQQRRSRRRSCWDLDTPQAFDAASAHVTPDDVARGRSGSSSDLGQHAAWIAELRRARVRRDLPAPRRHRSSASFLDAFGEHVLPQLDVASPRRRWRR